MTHAYLPTLLLTLRTLAVVVDDILVRGSPASTALFYKALGKKFECKEPSYLTSQSGFTYYCGLDITCTLQTILGISHIAIDQQVDLERYLEEIGVKNTKHTRNPMPNNSMLSTRIL